MAHPPRVQIIRATHQRKQVQLGHAERARLLHQRVVVVIDPVAHLERARRCHLLLALGLDHPERQQAVHPHHAQHGVRLGVAQRGHEGGVCGGRRAVAAEGRAESHRQPGGHQLGVPLPGAGPDAHQLLRQELVRCHPGHVARPRVRQRRGEHVGHPSVPRDRHGQLHGGAGGLQAEDHLGRHRRGVLSGRRRRQGWSVHRPHRGPGRVPALEEPMQRLHCTRRGRGCPVEEVHQEPVARQQLARRHHRLALVLLAPRHEHHNALLACGDVTATA
mmetsp:Transcript_9838/g.30967  ORF Transcript_9838/g.30967 Transcript_9838/m.30967 type:complete len:275 (-) Transcript_9838:2494-3318(-)